jgi:hypothetical protein
MRSVKLRSADTRAMLEESVAAGICAQRERFGLEPDECETPLLKELVRAVTDVGETDFNRMSLDYTFDRSKLTDVDRETLELLRHQDAYRDRGDVAALVKRLRETAHQERTLTDVKQAAEDGDLERVKRIADRPSPCPNTPKPRKLAEWTAFPLDCLPRSLSQYASDSAGLLGVDPAAIALPLLGSLAGIIGSRFTVSPCEARDDWREPIALWTCVILPSGSGKTPAQQRATKFLARIQDELSERASEENRSKSESDERVEPERILVADVTIEGLCKLLAANPNGLTCIVDELSSMIGSLGRYGQGNGRVQADRGQWLSLYNGERIMLDRKNSDPIYVPRAVASIVGNTQPGIARRLFDQGNQESGMLARFCTAWPPSKPSELVDRKPDAMSGGETEALFRRVHALPKDGDGPRRLWLGRDAFDVFKDFNDEQNARAHESEGNAAAATSKSPGLALRLAGILHVARSLLRFGADGRIGADGIPNGIDRSTAAEAVKLARWLNAERLRVYARLAADESELAAERLAESIPWPQYPNGITPTELHKRNRARFESAEAAELALRDAARRGLIAEAFGTRGAPQVGGRETLYYLPLRPCASDTPAQADR